jgi:transcription termination factor NusB
MDVKEEDKSEESKKNHISYYKSLTKVISNIQEEMNVGIDPTMKNHLDERLDALEKDRKRIRDMFPEIREEEWNGNTN